MSDALRFPAIPTPGTSAESITRTLMALKQAVELLSGQIDSPLKATLARDANTGPVRQPRFLVSTLPPPADWQGSTAYVADGIASHRLAISDGTYWRWPDGTIVS